MLLRNYANKRLHPSKSLFLTVLLSLPFNKLPCKYTSDYEVSSHDRKKYCPYCPDEWCCNGVRSGCEFTEMKVPVIDDRLYNSILEQQGDTAKYHLTNVVKASDLVTSTAEGHYKVIII